VVILLRSGLTAVEMLTQSNMSQITQRGTELLGISGRLRFIGGALAACPFLNTSLHPWTTKVRHRSCKPLIFEPGNSARRLHAFVLRSERDTADFPLEVVT
jgi:hypothetical protein